MKSDTDIEMGPPSETLSNSALSFRNYELLIADSVKEDRLSFDARLSAWRTSSIREMNLYAKLSSTLEPLSRTARPTSYKTRKKKE